MQSATCLQKRRLIWTFRLRGWLNVFSKIENFIRTKYESKRWVMDGGMPDPATLDTEGDDDVVNAPFDLGYISDC